MTRSRFLTAVPLLLLLVSLAAPLHGQTPTPIDVPKDLKPFWDKYSAAHDDDDEPGMDKAVRLSQRNAELMLDLLLDDLSVRDRPELHDEARTLARSLDRVAAQTQFIARVRYVLDLTQQQRGQRHQAMSDLDDAYGVINGAMSEHTEEGWTRAYDSMKRAEGELEALGDLQYTIRALRALADIESQRGNLWDRGQFLKRMIALGEKLDYRDVEVDTARGALIELKGKGIDADGPRPEPAPKDGAAPAGAGGAAGAGGTAGAGGAAAAPGADVHGQTLDSVKAGSADQVFTLALDAPKKGLSGIVLPGFYPLEQYFLWPTSYLDANGPSEISTGAPLPYVPFDHPLKVARDGAQFSIDSNGDAKPDVKFTPNSTPQRVEVPAPDGKSSIALMLSVPGDKETMFGLVVNYSPQPGGARLRINIASSMDGKVLDDTWKLMDTNLTGRFGDVQDCYGDLVTEGVDSNPVNFQETDAVLMGKNHVAIPWSTVLPVGDDFYRAAITPDGKSLTLHQLDLATGFVKLDMNTAVLPTHIILRETGKLQGAFLNVVPAKKGGTVKVPVGTWQLVSGRIEKGAKTSMQQVRIYKGQCAPVEVKAGETATLALGGPYHVEAQTKLDGKTTRLTSNTLRVFGRGKEEYAMFFDETLAPDVEARTADGHKFGKAEKMKRPDIEAWQTSKSSDRMVWFPLDFAMEAVKAEKLQLRLTQKTHSLLGGPFDSDWIP